MPEIPDIEVFCRNFKTKFVGKKLVKLVFKNSNKLKDSEEDLRRHLEGTVLEDIWRSGKEMRFKFSNGVIAGIHLMLSGDLLPFEKENEKKLTIIELHFEDGHGLALIDRFRNANIKLHPVDKDGVDALSKELNFKYLKQQLQRKTAVKNILIDQNVIRGIGNGYSDEILWECRISPYSVASAIPDDKIKELVKTIRKVLTTSTENIYQAYPGLTTGEVKDFLQIHTKKKTHSPTGAPIKLDKSGLRKTFYTDEQVLYK